jgi:hypothetical protein
LEDFQRGKPLLHFLLALLLSAFTSTSEAIGFLFILGVWVLLLNPPDGKRHWLKSDWIILLAILGFNAFSSPI